MGIKGIEGKPYKQQEEKKEFIDKAHEEALKDEQRLKELSKEEMENKGAKPEKAQEIKGETFLEKAQEILGKDFLGPEAVKNAFGVELESIPPIQFTEEDLKRAKELNQQLILYVDKTRDGKPLTGKELFELTKNQTSDGDELFNNTEWYKSEKFFTEETSPSSWKLVSKDVIPGSTSKNYLEQTKVIIDHLKDKIFKDRELPKEYQKAIAEFESQESDILKLIDSNWKLAADKLEKLQITKLTRESPIEVIYRIVLNEKINKERLLELESV